jgi:hypothetical protein
MRDRLHLDSARVPLQAQPALCSFRACPAYYSGRSLQAVRARNAFGSGYPLCPRDSFEAVFACCAFVEQ